MKSEPQFEAKSYSNVGDCSVLLTVYSVDDFLVVGLNGQQIEGSPLSYGQRHVFDLTRYILPGFENELYCVLMNFYGPAVFDAELRVGKDVLPIRFRDESGKKGFVYQLDVTIQR